MLTRKEAEAIAGTLSEPGKMPGYATSLSAEDCITGAILAEIVGSVCHKDVCYAKHGRYRTPGVQAALQRRKEGLTHPRWVEAMINLISRGREPYFRWFDSGDLQGLWHLIKITEVCSGTPDYHHWLPTREKQWARDKTIFIPSNLVIRVSQPMVNDPRPRGRLSSAVMECTDDVEWFERCEENDEVVHFCPASLQDDKCKDCRACWDPKIQHIVYRRH